MNKSLHPLSKIRHQTTKLGIYQFSINTIPDSSYGYALDDQARALIVASEFKDKELIDIYSNYFVRSMRPDGLLYQFSDKNGNFIDNNSEKESEISQDAFGETLWAILTTKIDRVPEIKQIENNILAYAEKWSGIRPISYALLGLSTLTNQIPLEKKFTDILLYDYEKHSDGDWCWFEEILTYGNAIIPWALWEIFLKRKDYKVKEVAIKATEFLYRACQTKGIPTPIGSEGWYKKNGDKALYIQQPICAGYMVCCLEKAYQATNDPKYKKWAKKWWKWFFGENILGKTLINNGACSDGIKSTGLNPNYGAESTICYVLALLAFNRLNL